MSAVTAAPPARGVRLGAAPGDLVDGAFLLALVGLGLLGFHAVYGGTAFLAVGLTGTVLGVAVSLLAARLRQPLVAEGLVAVLLFFLLGGALAARSSALGGVLPTGSTLRALASTGVHGWKELLTTAAPVGASADLLVLPYLIGLAAGVVGCSLATRTRVPAAPVAVPAAVLGLGILFGGRTPVSLLAQGTVFSVVAVGWVAVRHERRRDVTRSASVRRNRTAAAIGLLVAAALLGQVVAGALPGHQRVVLDRYVVPPVDPSTLSSPLVAFRSFTPGAPHSLSSADLFTVHGVSAGSLVRLATMDAYDGSTFGFAAPPAHATGATAIDAFRSVGARIATDAQGVAVHATVTVAKLGGVFVPSIGAVTGLSLDGASSDHSPLRVDQVTGTVLDVAGVHAGQVVHLDAVVPPAPTPSQLASASPAGDQVTATIPHELQATASTWTAQATGAWARVTAIAAHLKTDGRYSNGTETPPLALPGHSTGRLVSFISGGGDVGKQIVGDDEQFAATMALMCDAVGVPARVVLGAVVPAGGVVTGADVHAWVEVALSPLGWVSVAPKLFIPTTAPSREPPQPQPQASATPVVSPPVVSTVIPPDDTALPSSAPSNGRNAAKHANTAHRHGVAAHLPAWVGTVARDVSAPIGLLVALGLLVVAAKGLRRRRRQRSGPVLARVAGAWRELLDAAADLGHRAEPAGTRTETARTLAGLGAGTALRVATAADSAVFGPGEPDPAHVTGLWELVDAARRELVAGLPVRRRLRAAVNPVTLLRAPRAAGGRR
ncbi:MAG TPA: transglutaminase domain-containing protein [Acidimicrobiales bacterium]|nr:transglutaminase domain-containing protein [Acidimicrobiales bacterium]